MTYRIAAPQDHSRIAAFYRDVIERTPRFAETVRWKFGQHPSPVTLERYISDLHQKARIPEPVSVLF